MGTTGALPGGKVTGREVGRSLPSGAKVSG